MPERSFRVIITNQTSSNEGFTLQQTTNHLCGGEWTSGDWTPKATIKPGDSGGLQSESDGFMTGTEGYVKYDVIGPAGRAGMIYIYWDNPFYGTTHFRFVAAAEDVFPDCDFDPPSGGSSFSNPPALGFDIQFAAYKSGTAGGATITSPGDLVHFVVGPVSFAGLIGIDKNPELDLALVATSTSSSGVFGNFGNTGPITLTLLSDATPDQWAGRWGAEGVDITIRQTQSTPPLSVTVVDTAAAPPLNFTQSVTPGAIGLTNLPRSPWATFLEGETADPATRSALAQASQAVIQEAGASPAPPLATAKRFDSIVGGQGPASAVGPGGTSRVGRVLGTLVQDRGGVAYLDNGIALRLFGLSQSGTPAGAEIQYQRLDPHGDPLLSRMLQFIPDVH
ncbi:MAG: hypothetical protein JO038_07575 [Alphaproteobacteria bacterium]|nr:hypothetical protein [Alphaproteobacteria bacterium]